MYNSTFGGGAVVPMGAATPDGMLLGMATPFDDKMGMCLVLTVRVID